MMRGFIILFSLLGFAGCVDPQKAAQRIVDLAPQEVALKCKVERDEFVKTVTVTSPEIPPLDRHGLARMVAARLSSGSEDFYVVYRAFASDVCYFTAAVDRSGRPLAVEQINLDWPSGRDAYEVVRVNLSRTDFEQHAKGVGLNFKLYGRLGTAEIYFPTNYVQGFLSAVTAAK